MYRLVPYLGPEHGYASISVVCWLRVLCGDTQEQSGWLLWYFYFKLPLYQFPQWPRLAVCHSLETLYLPFSVLTIQGGARQVSSCERDPRNLRIGDRVSPCGRWTSAGSSALQCPQLCSLLSSHTIPSPLRPLVTNVVHMTCPKKYSQSHFLMWPFSSQETSRTFLLLTTPVGP